MISDVVFERLRANDVFAVAPVRKGQKSSAISELICDTVRTVGMPKSAEVISEDIVTHSSGVIACILPAFASATT